MTDVLCARISVWSGQSLKYDRRAERLEYEDLWL